MTRRTLNIIMGIMVAFIVMFFAGSYAYENYLMAQSDKQYEEQLENDLNNASKENQSGSTNQETRN